MTKLKSAVDVLVDQHVHIRKLFDEVASTSGQERRNAFAELRRMLAVHEAAEEMVTHPAVKRAGADEVVDSRLAEEHDAKVMLAALDRMDSESAEFEERLRLFRDAMLVHADAEERLEFPLLLTQIPPDELERMGQNLKRLEKAAPTRPHPVLGEAAVANALGMPFATVLDRARDLVGDVFGRHS